MKSATSFIRQTARNQTQANLLFFGNPFV